MAHGLWPMADSTVYKWTAIGHSHKPSLKRNLMLDLKNKTALVTGANSGMGMATVEALSDKGATVIML